MPPLGKLDKNELKIFMVNDYIVLHVTDTTPSSQRRDISCFSAYYVEQLVL